MMKNVIISLITIFLLGCSSSELQLSRIDRFKNIEVMNIGNGATITVSEVTYSRGNKDKIEKYISNSGESILSSELKTYGFTVLERKQFVELVKEYNFAENMTNKVMNSNFMIGKYTAFMNITNISLQDSGIMVPLIYNDIKHKVEVSVNVKLVNNETGSISYGSGTAIVGDSSKNALLFFGDFDKDLSKALETCLKLATRDAILNLKN